MSRLLPVMVVGFVLLGGCLSDRIDSAQSFTIGAACDAMSPCDTGEYCEAASEGTCGAGVCAVIPPCSSSLPPACGCDGNDYNNVCGAIGAGVSVIVPGAACSGTGSGTSCLANTECQVGEYCDVTDEASCGAAGTCQAFGPCNSSLPNACGCDGVTYNNRCGALAAGVTQIVDGGPCGTNPGSGGGSCLQKSDCGANEYCDVSDEASCGVAGTCMAFGPCNSSLPAACGCDGSTYNNRCGAVAAGVAQIVDGGACGTNPGSGGGSCLQKSDCGALEYCDVTAEAACGAAGTCTPFGPCSGSLPPACGCDGITYNNRCGAVGAGAAQIVDGVSCGSNPGGGGSCMSAGDCTSTEYCDVTSEAACGVAGTCMPFGPCSGSLPAACGCNGITYNNRCGAYAAGVAQIVDGAGCGTPPPAGGCAETRISFTPGGSSIWPHASWTGSEFGMVWEERDFTVAPAPISREIFFTRLDAMGAPSGSPVQLTNNNAADSTTPRLAWNGNHYGVAWEDNSTGDHLIYFARLDSVGNIVTSAVAVSATTGRTGEAALSPLDIVVSSTGWGILWESETATSKEIFFRHVSAAGVPQGAPVQVSGGVDTASRTPKMVWDDVNLAINGAQDFLVVWSDARHGDTEIYSRKVSVAGVLGSEQRISNAGGNSWAPEVIGNGTGFAVVWTDNRAASGGSMGVVDFLRLDLAGIPIAGSMRTLRDGSTQTYIADIAWSGSSYQVVWNDVDPNASPSTTDEVFYAIMDANGDVTFGPSFMGIEDTGASGYEQVIWNGSLFLTTYYDGSIGNNDIYSSITSSTGLCL